MIDQPLDTAAARPLGANGFYGASLVVVNFGKINSIGLPSLPSGAWLRYSRHAAQSTFHTRTNMSDPHSRCRRPTLMREGLRRLVEGTSDMVVAAGAPTGKKSSRM